jgi:Bacterial proteasome activator
MSDPQRQSEPAELVAPARPEDAERMEDEATGDAVTSPAKVMRIGSMVKMLLEEVRAAPLDEPSRERLAEIYERSITELSDALSPDLQNELKMLALPFRDGEIPTEGEIRVAKAQLVGWLEGLFHGIQATLFAQQLAARQQLEQIRQLPSGVQPGTPGQPIPPDRPGTYL